MGTFPVPVKAGFSWFFNRALGTDTGGSVRLPAAYTGIFGLKPSYGLIPRWGVVSYANSLDTVGVMARDMDHLCGLFRSLTGNHLAKFFPSTHKKGVQPPKQHETLTASFPMANSDPRDPTIVNRRAVEKANVDPLSDGRRLEDTVSRKLRIGVPKEYNTQELDPEIRKVWMEGLESLQASGHSIHSVSLPTTHIALSAYYVIAAAEASSNLAKYDGVRYGKASPNAQSGLASFAESRALHLGEEAKRRILLGSYTLSAGAIDNHFIKAQKVRRQVQMDFNKVFRLKNPLLDHQDSGPDTDGVDVLLTPTAPSFPPSLDSLDARSPTDTFADDVMTVPASLAGIPAISVPIDLSGWLGTGGPVPPKQAYVGLQVIGQYGSDTTVLHMGRHLRQQIMARRRRDGQLDSAEEAKAG